MAEPATNAGAMRTDRPHDDRTQDDHAGVDAELARAIDQVLDAQAPDWTTAAGLIVARPVQLEALRIVADVAAGCRRLRADEGTQRPPPLFRWGTLEVREKIATGASAEVYRAHDPALGIDVALKLHRDGAHSPPAGRFLAEARHLARVRQRNIVGIYGAAVHDGRAGLWCEWIDGAALSDLLREQGALSAVEAAYVGIELCHALAALHAAGLLHADLKPGNVLRERGGRIVLVDLGAGGVAADAATAFDAYGTPDYLPAEVLAGAPRAPQHDLYSLGRLLQALLAGTPGAPLPDGVPTSLRSVLARATAAEPARRYARAADFERDLIGVLAGATGVAAPAAPRTTRPHAGWIAAVALMVAAIIAVAVASWNGSGAAWQTQLTLKRRTPAGEEALADGASLATGDRLILELSSNEPSNVYVLNEDGNGALHVLFPLAGLALQNPLPSGTRVQLPGRDGVRELSWELSGDSPREEFLVVVAREPLASLEQRLARAPQAAFAPQRGVQRVAAQLPPTLRVEGAGLAAVLDDLAPRLADAGASRAVAFHFRRAEPR